MANRHLLCALCFIIFMIMGCNQQGNTNKPSTDSKDLIRLKVDETLLHAQIVLLMLKAQEGEIPFSSVMLDTKLSNLHNDIKKQRKQVPVTDKLRESNIINYLKSQMNDPFSFRLHEITYARDNEPYRAYEYSIAKVEYFGANVYGATMRHKTRLRVSPHGFVVSEQRN